MSARLDEEGLARAVIGIEPIHKISAYWSADTLASNELSASIRGWKQMAIPQSTQSFPRKSSNIS
jgi:hypothetical protein